MGILGQVLLAVTAALSALAVVLNAGLKKYVEEKAKHLATREDLKQLVEEVRIKAVASKEGEITGIQNKLDIVVEQNNKIVTSTEVIKNEISTRQRMWELKRECAYDAVRTVGLLKGIMVAYQAARASIVEDRGKSGTAGAATLIAHLELARKRYRSTVETRWQLEGVMTLLFDDSVTDSLRKLGVSSGELVTAIERDVYNPEEAALKRDVFKDACFRLVEVLQTELKKPS
jgi:hypothetical protein